MFLRFIHANICLNTPIFEPSSKRKKGDKNMGSVFELLIEFIL